MEEEEYITLTLKRSISHGANRKEQYVSFCRHIRCYHMITVKDLSVRIVQ